VYHMLTQRAIGRVDALHCFGGTIRGDLIA
jgi:hypothetical protein